MNIYSAYEILKDYVTYNDECDHCGEPLTVPTKEEYEAIKEALNALDEKIIGPEPEF